MVDGGFFAEGVLAEGVAMGFTRGRKERRTGGVMHQNGSRLAMHGSQVPDRTTHQSDRVVESGDRSKLPLRRNLYRNLLRTFCRSPAASPAGDPGI